MRTLVTLLILITASFALAEETVESWGTWDPPAERRIIFNPVVSTSARTLPQWSVGFQRASGVNIHSNLLANALSIGVLPRVELGMVPLFYLERPGSSNYTGRLNFFKGDEFDWAASFTQTRFSSEVKVDGKVTERPDLVMRSFQLGFNYHPEGSDLTLSPFANHVCGYADSTDNKTYTDSLRCKFEWGADLQYQLKDREWITLAYGYLRQEGISATAGMHSGGGIAYSQFRPKEMFSRPSLGVYYSPATTNTLYLISTTFFEL